MTLAYELGYDECLELLRGGVAGRVAIGSPDGPHIVPVNYTVLDDAIYFRTAPYSVLGTYARNALVAFEVDRLDEAAQLGWSVVARGRCNAVLDPSELRRVSHLAGPRPWAKGQRTLLLALHWRELTGRRLVRPPGEALDQPADTDPALL